MNVIFICKYNKFRSQVAEAYFNKLDKNNSANSAGIFVGSYPLDKLQVATAKKLGIIMNGKPKPITTRLLKEQDLIVIVANNIPKKLFKYQDKYIRKTIVWKIPDEQYNRADKIEKIIIKIKQKVEKLIEELK